MAHEIYANAFVANDGKTAWHGLGKVRTMVQTFGEAIEEILDGATYTIEPAGTFNPNLNRWEALPHQRQVTFRDPNNEKRPVHSFGLVSKDYQIISPDRIAALLSDAVAGMPVATIGLLKKGSCIFVALDAGKRTVVGEEYQDYLTFDLSFEPGRVMQVYATPVRTVCANTQVFGKKASTINMGISHTGDVNGKMALAASFVASFEERKDFFRILMEHYVAHSMTRLQTKKVLDAAYPVPPRPKILCDTLDKLEPAEIAALTGNEAIADLIQDLTSKERDFVNSTARSERTRALARHAIRTFDADYPEFAGTAYSVYNGITQTSDHRVGKGGVGESVLVGIRFGEKVRAAEVLTKIVGMG